MDKSGVKFLKIEIFSLRWQLSSDFRKQWQILVSDVMGLGAGLVQVVEGRGAINLGIPEIP